MEMEDGNNVGPGRSVSFGRISNGSSSLRRHSSSFSRTFGHQVDDNSDSDLVSEAGDIGDRVLFGSRSGRGSEFRLSFGSVGEKGSVVPISHDNLVLPITDANVPTTRNVTSETAETNGVDEKQAPWVLVYISLLVLLALFGILGVITRYYLEKLFGPGVIGATGDKNYMYLDLPCNMVGSFLMGWLGVVYKQHITNVSTNLATGLATGFLGSLTTFSGWNQKMLDLSVEGSWGFAVLGFLISLILCHYSIIYGILTANGFKSHLQRLTAKRKLPCFERSRKSRGDLIAMVVLLLTLAVIWCVCIIFAKKQFNSSRGHAQLLIACIVGPFGVWIRWRLARLNGLGLGKGDSFKWVPFGTLTANVLAASIMAALAILKKAVNTSSCDTIATGIQIGFLGCLSTVSTFIAEFHAMRESKYWWRAEVYASATILISFGLGTLIYSVPVWSRGYD